MRADHFWRSNVHPVRDGEKKYKLLDIWTWIKLLDVSTLQVRVTGRFWLLCAVLGGRRQLLSCTGHWKSWCSCSSWADNTGVFLHVGHTALNEKRGKQRSCLWFATGQEKHGASQETCCAAEQRAAVESGEEYGWEKHHQETEAVSFPYWEWI